MSELVPILSEFMTIEELAAELGRNKRTLDRWDALGTGPPRTRVQKTQIELEIGFVKFAIGELMADSLCALFRVAYGQQKKSAVTRLCDERR